MRNPFIWLFTCLVLPCCVSAALPWRYRITDIGPACDDQRVAINNRTQIVGTFYTHHPIVDTMPDSTAYHAFLWQRGRRQDLGTLRNYPNSSASGINDKSQIVGTLDATTDGAIMEYDDHAFLWEHGRMRDLGVPHGDALTEATAINNLGQIIGAAQDSGWLPDVGNFAAVEAHRPHVFLLKGNTWKVLGLNAAYGISGPTGLNDSGQIVGKGMVVGDDNDHALLWQNGTATPLPLPPGDTINQNLRSLYAVNDRGQIVGAALKQSPQGADGRAMLWQNGNVFDLDTLIPPGSGWTLQQATGINDKGQIVGIGTYLGDTHAFLLTPIKQLGHGGKNRVQ